MSHHPPTTACCSWLKGYENFSLRVDKMDRINHIHLTDNRFFLIIMLVGVLSQASADEALGSTIDCSTVEIGYVDNPEWTQNERLEAMDRAFFESVDRFEFCNLSNQSSSSSSSASGANQGAGSGSESGDGDEANQSASTGSEGGLDSTASTEMSGTETAPPPPPMDVSENSGQQENTNGKSGAVKGGSSANGVRPKDIPPADNDDVIAAQIRLAAEIEKDPVKKEKLWNEYRKYKGLPVK